MKNDPTITITKDMIDEYHRLAQSLKEQNRAGILDHTHQRPTAPMIGHLGEMIFAQWKFGDFRKHNINKNWGDEDYPGYEIKASGTPMSGRVSLMCKEWLMENKEYAKYVQVIIDIARGATPKPGDTAYIIGWATHDELKDGIIRSWPGATHKAYSLDISKLHPMKELI